MKVHLGWFVVILFCLAMYPCNFYMMQNEVGVYSNDPAHRWYWAKWREGPSPILRSISLVLSPGSVPLNGLYWVAEQTFDPLTQPEPPATTPAPLPKGVTRCT